MNLETLLRSAVEEGGRIEISICEPFAGLMGGNRFIQSISGQVNPSGDIDFETSEEGTVMGLHPKGYKIEGRYANGRVSVRIEGQYDRKNYTVSGDCASEGLNITIQEEGKVVIGKLKGTVKSNVVKLRFDDQKFDRTVYNIETESWNDGNPEVWIRNMSEGIPGVGEVIYKLSCKFTNELTISIQDNRNHKSYNMSIKYTCAG